MAKAPYEADVEVEEKSQHPAVDKDITDDISATQSRLAKLRQAAKDRASRLNSTLLAAKAESTGLSYQDKPQEPNRNPIEELPEKAQNAETELSETQLTPPEDFLKSKTGLELTTEYIATRGIAGQNRLPVAEKVERIIEETLRAQTAATTGQGETPEPGFVAAEEARRGGKRKEATPRPLLPTNEVPPPTEAPAKYAEIDRESGKKIRRREGVVNFMLDAYAPWIVPDPDGGPRPVLTLPRKLIEQLDPDCDKAISQWSSNHTGQKFPIQIDRKNGVEPVNPEEAREARRLANRADYLRRREAQGRGGRL